MRLQLNSADTTFDFDVFIGTGFIQFDIPCTADEHAMYEKYPMQRVTEFWIFTYAHFAC